MTVDAVPTTNGKDESNLCPVCRQPFIGDFELGEVVCPNCGFVAEEEQRDYGPDWKAIDPDEKARRVRVGSPMTYALHDFGLATEISSTMKDSQGKSLPGHMRQSVDNMRRWQTRVRTTSAERSLTNVLTKINEISTTLSLPKSVIETAAYIYRLTVRKKIAKSKSVIGMAAASVYLACRKCAVGRTLKEIARATGLETRVVAKYYRLVLNEVESEYVPPPSVERHISKLINSAKIDTKVERLALNLSSNTQDTEIHSGKAPAGLAAAYVYMAASMLGDHIPQREIAELAEVTEVTVRNRCREILDNFRLRQTLKPLSK
ncbi:MAG: transcription initiation factor IIB family protein [Nitrososphaerales archaeon]